jgi:putative spermidine/putrescine transport system substrate-binding protein
VDVVIMDTTTAAIACAEGLIEKITPDMLPMLGDLDPQARDANGCGPAVTFDHFIIAYDSKSVQPAPTSLMELKDPKWKGRVSLSSPPNIQALALTSILAQSEGGDWRKADTAFKTLREMAPNVQTFDPQPDGYTLILNDTLAFATGWNARAQLFHDKSQGRVGVMLPKEGTVLQLNMINLVKGAPHREAGLAFMRYALSPEAQKAFTERMFYGPTNSKAQISPDAAARTSAGAENKGKIIPVDWNEMVKLRDNWTQRWRREVIPAGGR